MKGNYICLVCNKVFDEVGESVLHNYGDHTTGMDKKEFELQESVKESKQ